MNPRTHLLIFIILFATKSFVAAQEIDSTQLSENENIEKILKTAYDNLGVPYKYAGKKPETGFDCSGFVHYVHSMHGYNLPSRSRDYVKIGKEIKLKKCKPGDIILFAGRNPKTTPVGHVGIITQVTDQDVLFIHSASSANRGIVISRLSMGYYKNRLAGIRRIKHDNN